jgi:hypothetical protein
MLAVTVKYRGPTPIPAHGTYRHRKRHPPRRAERQNPHSCNTVALRGFVQDGFCNGCPLPDHAVIALAISHHRNLNIARRILYGHVEPLFGEALFVPWPANAKRHAKPTMKGRLVDRVWFVLCGVGFRA